MSPNQVNSTKWLKTKNGHSPYKHKYSIRGMQIYDHLNAQGSPCRELAATAGYYNVARSTRPSCPRLGPNRRHYTSRCTSNTTPTANDDKTIASTCNQPLARCHVRHFFISLYNQNRFCYCAHETTVIHYCWCSIQPGYRIAICLIWVNWKTKSSCIVCTNFTITFGPIKCYRYGLNEFLLSVSRCWTY